jgi:hypothetical protein
VKFNEEKKKTDEIYKYLALLEKPVEDNLKTIRLCRKLLTLLDKEKHLLEGKDEMGNKLDEERESDDDDDK